MGIFKSKYTVEAFIYKIDNYPSMVGYDFSPVIETPFGNISGFIIKKDNANFADFYNKLELNKGYLLTIKDGWNRELISVEELPIHTFCGKTRHIINYSKYFNEIIFENNPPGAILLLNKRKTMVNNNWYNIKYVKLGAGHTYVIREHGEYKCMEGNDSEYECIDNNDSEYKCIDDNDSVNKDK